LAAISVLRKYGPRPTHRPWDTKPSCRRYRKLSYTPLVLYRAWHSWNSENATLPKLPRSVGFLLLRQIHLPSAEEHQFHAGSVVLHEHYSANLGVGGKASGKAFDLFSQWFGSYEQ